MRTESHDELSQTLRQLKVAAPALDRDRLLFEAGRRSVRRSWVWPMATAVSVMVACSMSIFAWWPQPTMERIVYLPAIESPSSTVAKQEYVNSLTPLDDAVSYVMLRQEMFATVPFPRIPNISPGKSTTILTAGSFIQQSP